MSVCRKTSYSTEYFADLDIKKFQYGDRKIKPTRSYYCTKCKTWHLTSLPITSISLKKCYSKIIELESLNSLLNAKLITLEKYYQNNHIQIQLRKVKEQLEKQKRITRSIKEKFAKKSDELQIFRNEVIKIINKK